MGKGSAARNTLLPWHLKRAFCLCCRVLGEDDEADLLARSTLKTRERVLGPEHSNTLTSKVRLAKLLEDKGAYEESLKLYSDVLCA